MNAFFQYQHRLNEQFINSIDASSFYNLYDEHVDYFKQYIRPTFDYAAFSERTQRCKSPLKYFDDLNSYIALYGLAHYQRMRTVVEHVQGHSRFQLTHPVQATLVDYGCGQGIATLAFIDHLIETHHQIDVLNIILIEPSTLALQRAIHWINLKAKQHGFSVNYTIHACTFDELTADYLYTENCYPYIHLFSNVLDMHYTGSYSLDAISEKIKGVVAQHFLFAVSPSFLTGNMGFNRLNQLINPDKVYLNTETTIEVDRFDLYHFDMRKHASKLRCYAAHLKG